MLKESDWFDLEEFSKELLKKYNVLVPVNVLNELSMS